jgi:hypothetical protein
MTRPVLIARSADVGVVGVFAALARRSFGRSIDRGGRVKTARERAQEKRLEKLELIRAQVASGVLVIRQMTDQERRQYPARHVQPKRTGQR